MLNKNIEGFVEINFFKNLNGSGEAFSKLTRGYDPRADPVRSPSGFEYDLREHLDPDRT